MVAGRGENLTNAISNASNAFGSIARQNVAFDQTLRQLPPVFRQSNTTFVNLRAALDDLDPLVETAKPATKNLAPFLAELRPVISKAVPLFKNLRLTVNRPGKENDAGELLAALPEVQQRAAKAFPHSEDAIADFQPNLNFIRAYTPDIFNGFAKVGQITGYYDGNGHYARISFSNLNIFNYNGSELKPIPQSQQYEAFGSSAGVTRRCPGGATQSAARRLEPVRRTAPHGLRRDPVHVQPGRRATRTMKSRKGLIALVVVAVIVAIVLVSGGGGSNGYVIRAVFDNGGFMVKGEQVRVAGATVGEIESVGVTMPGEVDTYENGKAEAIPGQGGDRDEHHRPRLPGLPPRRDLPDPPAVADRREVRRLPPDPAAGAGHGAAAGAAQDQGRPAGRRPVPAAAGEQQHHASTRT